MSASYMKVRGDVDNRYRFANGAARAADMLNVARDKGGLEATQNSRSSAGESTQEYHQSTQRCMLRCW
jgi:hypothetical protein